MTAPHHDDDLTFGDTLLRDQLTTAVRGVTPDVERLVLGGRAQGRRQQRHSRTAWTTGVAAAAALAVGAIQAAGQLGDDVGQPSRQPADTPPDPTPSDAIVPAGAPGLAAAVIAQLDGASIDAVHAEYSIARVGEPNDYGTVRLETSAIARIELTYGGVPANLEVTAWQPGSEEFDPEGVSCSSMSQVDYRKVSEQQLDMVSFGCDAAQLPDQRSGWWVAIETIQPDGQGTPVVKQLSLLLTATDTGTPVSQLRPHIDALREIARDDTVGYFTTQALKEAGETLPGRSDVSD